MPVSRVIGVVALLSFVCQPSLLWAQTTTQPTENKGAVVGKLITSAIDAALPGVGRLIELFRPKGNENEQKKVVASARATLKSEAAAQLKALASVAAELGAVEGFLSKTVPASTRISRLLGHLDQAKPDPSLIAGQWKESESFLVAIGALQKTAQDHVKEPALQVTLLQVSTLNREAAPEIGRALAKQDWADARVQLRAVQASLNGVLAIASVEIARLQSDLAEVVKWANNPAGKFAPETGRDSLYLNEAKLALDEARKRYPK